MKELPEGVILYGDSVFFGVGALPFHRECAHYLRKILPVQVDNRSWPGVNSRKAYERLDKKVLSNLFSNVVINFGNNDCRIGDKKRFVQLDEYARNMAEMIRAIRNHRSKPYVCGLPPIAEERFQARFPEIREYFKIMGNCSSWLSKYNEKAREVAEIEEVVFIDIRPKLEERLDELIRDEGHPTPEGHQIVAKVIKSSLGY